VCPGRIDRRIVMDKQGQQARSHLFTVRLWVEELGDGEREWRGKVQHVPSGDMCYFREWSRLIAFLLEVLPTLTRDADAG
jgi:hypothetical protein